MGHRPILAGKERVLLFQTEPGHRGRSDRAHLPQLVEISRKSIQRVADHGVALADVLKQELRRLGLLVGGLINKRLVDRHPLELTELFLNFSHDSPDNRSNSDT